jgi:acetylornithine/succinyldiaminopimelate/putrescine aminotransferase
MTLAKRVTTRSQIIAFQNSYHGSTQGALSIIGSEYWRNAFRPLLPGITHAEYNSYAVMDDITEQTACVIAETVRGEAGVAAPSKEWIQALRHRCNETGCLLILDEIQAGFGRTGKLWGFDHFEVVPDIVLLGKALGGGMPLGAFVSSKKSMDALTDDPVLGHITTFGGHPVCCAAGMAAFKVLLEEKLVDQVPAKTAIFQSLLKHDKIRQLRSFGLWLAVEFNSFETNKKVIDYCLSHGVLTDWFLFASNCLRICPPLNIHDEQIEEAATVIQEALRET